MPNGGPHGDHFAEGQYAWGYKEGYAKGYRQAILEIALTPITDPKELPNVLAAMLETKFPEQKPRQVADDSEFLPSDVPRESDDD